MKNAHKRPEKLLRSAGRQTYDDCTLHGEKEVDARPCTIVYGSCLLSLYYPTINLANERLDGKHKKEVYLYLAPFLLMTQAYYDKVNNWT